MASPRNGVIVVTPPPEWRPQSVNAIPPSFTTARFYLRRVSLVKAATVAEAFNRDILRRKAFGGEWAMLFCSINRWDRFIARAKADPVATEGGAA
jgi:hypothetical protein